MIKIVLKGGLGNQMFQYAAAKSLAIENKTELCIDLSFLNNRIPIKDFTRRSYDLDLFKVKDKIYHGSSDSFFEQYLAYPINFLQNRLTRQNTYIEGPNYYYYDEEFGKLGPDLTIEGYLNNPKYFLNHESEIKNIFNPDKLYDSAYNKIEDSIKNTNAVSINIRRGDYLNPKHKNVFTFLGEDYYKEAISIIEKKVKNPHFFVFSYDDPEWFKKTFNMDSSEYTMLDAEYIGYKFKTYLRLISLCKHNIISNSTFAWWGAYLNKNDQKLVVTPKRWMYKYDFDVLPSWITINNK